MDQRSEGSQSDRKKPAKESSRQPQSAEGSVKDTIESILVAFMLAFIFRAFVVEAFVIPTGSMAPTLLGAHMRFRCPDCGYRFDVNYQGTDEGGSDIQIPPYAKDRTYAIFCPNCGYRLPRYSAQDPQNDASEPTIRYGDRILVLKYLYLFQPPQRWDVVVFKSPYDPRHYDYSQNYIKRLIGLPGETIMVLDGDIYTSRDPAGALDSFTVQTKPPKVQDALWRIVYDNDYLPRGIDRSKLLDVLGNPEPGDPPWQQPWQMPSDETGWQTSSAGSNDRDFEFNNPTGSATLNFNPEANPSKAALTDWLAYDITENQGPASSKDTYRIRTYEPDNTVSDVKLDFVYQRRTGEGPLRVQLTKINDRFETAITAHDVTLLMNGNVVDGPVPLTTSPGPLRVQMINVDYRVSVRIDQKEVLATTPQQYHPDVKALMQDFQQNHRLPKPKIQIIGDRQTCELSHINLWRDIYYLNRGQRRNTRDENTVSPLWASPEGYPANRLQLGAGEYFVMGDNSFVSLDARYWDDYINLPHEQLQVRAGRVPQRFMLGKAFFVYWPAGYPPIDSAPAIVPDFGDLRFIH